MELALDPIEPLVVKSSMRGLPLPERDVEGMFRPLDRGAVRVRRLEGVVHFAQLDSAQLRGGTTDQTLGGWVVEQQLALGIEYDRGQQQPVPDRRRCSSCY